MYVLEAPNTSENTTGWQEQNGMILQLSRNKKVMNNVIQ